MQALHQTTHHHTSPLTHCLTLSHSLTHQHISLLNFSVNHTTAQAQQQAVSKGPPQLPPPRRRLHPATHWLHWRHQQQAIQPEWGGGRGWWCCRCWWCCCYGAAVCCCCVWQRAAVDRRGVGRGVAAGGFGVWCLLASGAGVKGQGGAVRARRWAGGEGWRAECEQEQQPQQRPVSCIDTGVLAYWQQQSVQDGFCCCPSVRLFNPCFCLLPLCMFACALVLL